MLKARIVHIIAFLFMSLNAVFAQVLDDSTSANPFAVIEYIEHRISGNKAVNVDSIKYELAKQYVMDYVTLGQPVAYDSLSQRAMRYMYSFYSESSPSNYVSLDDIENEYVASESELYRLRRENEELKKRVNSLEYNSRKNGIHVVSKEEQARTNAWVQKVLKSSKISADSMTLKSLKLKDKIYLPLCFTSVSDEVFKPHFVDTQVVQVGIEDTMSITRKLARRKLERNLEDRLLFKVSLSDPSNIAYYGLGEYVAPDFKLKDRRVKLIDIKQTNPEDYEFEPPSMRKQKRVDEVWKTQGKVNVSFVTYFISHWSGGGKNTTTFMSDFRLDRNYKKDPRRWNNRLDMYLGFIYYEKDKTHPFRINEDETTISSTYLIKMKKHQKFFFMAPSAKMKTHLFTSYDSYNDTSAATSFLTPTNIYLGSGIYYEHNRNMSIGVLPVCGRLFWLINDKLYSEDHGLDADKRASIAPGYKVETDMLWKITRGVSINNELSFFVPYSPKVFSNDIMMDWKLSGNFTVNRFFSAQLMFKLIFDKRVKSEYREWPQIQQKYSLKFTYAF